MLILSRKYGESIVIGKDIMVKVIKMKGNVVQLGIDAPKEIPVHRSELCKRIRENERSLAAPMEKLDQEGRSELQDAVIDPREVKISKLLAAGPDVSRKGQRRVDAGPFRRSEASGGNRKNTDGTGARADSKDKSGSTPLWRAEYDYRGD